MVHLCGLAPMVPARVLGGVHQAPSGQRSHLPAAAAPSAASAAAGGGVRAAEVAASAAAGPEAGGGEGCLAVGPVVMTEGIDHGWPLSFWKLGDHMTSI